ncbi:semaphorin-4B-like [Takifugu rubripes]|uniref:semaphorin-4B-like n=1 Tax=Takifugu rubripes TaxID=31033 RepID=UPI001145ACCE|nr:semaphorin-4B-like [Takifugu rubripes]
MMVSPHHHPGYVCPEARRRQLGQHCLLWSLYVPVVQRASGSSALCAFTMAQVERAFNSRYREVNRETQRWYTYNHPCVTNQARHMGIHSSLHMPDKVLNFIKDHFLMDGVIRSSPLLLKRSVHYTQIAVHKIQGMERAYDVLFIGTDDGKLHKAINANDKMHIIEEMVLFPEPEPVQHVELDPQRPAISRRVPLHEPGPAQVLLCKLRSNLAQRQWRYSDNAGQFLYVTPVGNLVVLAQAGRMETYECWSEEEGFRQLLANYCLIAEPHQESTTLRAHSRTPRFEHEESIILPGESHSEQVYTKTYWNELIVVCGLLAFSFVVFSLFVLCRNQDHMKSMLKQGECTPSMQEEAKDCGKAHRELSP